jgi:2-methylcitrate dehydratase PrpD
MSGQSPSGAIVTEILVDRLARPVDAATRRRAALHVLDWAGCAVAAAEAPAAQAAQKAFGRESLFFQAAIGNILEMDDVDKRALLHPGPVVIPTAIAAARNTDASPEDFLDAVVRGYEAMIRVGRAVGPAHYRYWHNTATCGVFGAAAAAASLLSLDREQTVWTLGLAGTQASGFWQVRHEPASFAKQLHCAHAAEAGLKSAELARAGFVGLRSVLEGPQGFFAATCGEADPTGVVAFSAYSPWSIHDVSFKPWPACRHAHAAIDAALALARDGVSAASIDIATIRTYKDAIVFCDNPRPRTTIEAKFSLQHAVAVALLRGKPLPEDFEAAAREDRSIAALREKISVVEDATFTARYPARFGSAVEIRTFDSRNRSQTIDDALGDPENPAPQSLIVEKARRLLSAGRAANAEEVIDAALALGDGGSLLAFRRALSGALRT